MNLNLLIPRKNHLDCSKVKDILILIIYTLPEFLNFGKN